jgi:hypothetical protein
MLPQPPPLSTHVSGGRGICHVASVLGLECRQFSDPEAADTHSDRGTAFTRCLDLNT